MKYKTIGELCEILNGYAFVSSKYVDKGIRIIRIANVQKGYVEDNTPAFYPIDTVGLEKYMLEENDLLMSLTGNVGRVALLSKELLPAALNQRVACLRLKDNTISKKYLYHLLNSDFFESKCIQASNGIAQKNLSTEWLKNYEVPIYSKKEEQNIILLLDDIQNIIRNRKEQLKKLDELIKYRFVEMFGDPEINSKCWNIQSLAEHLNVVGGYAFKSDEFVEHGIPILRIGNINTGHFKPTNLVFWNDTKELYRYKIYPGDLVMSLTGTVGKNDYGNVCILGNDYNEYYLNQRNAKLELKNTINKYYLLQLLKFNIIKEKLTGISRGVRQANISNKDILNLTVPIPPIDLQNKFELFVKQVDKSKVIVMNILKILYQRVTL